MRRRGKVTGMDGMILGILIAVFVLGGVVYAALSSRTADRKLRANLENRFGKAPDGDAELESAAVPWKTAAGKESGCFVDDTTWNDLDMDSVFLRIDSCETSLGEEYLYLLLRRFSDAGETERRARMMDCLDQDPELRLRLQYLLHKVGKSNYNGLAGFLENSEDCALPHAWAYRVLAALPLASLCVLPFRFAAGMILTLCFLCVNILASYLAGRRIEQRTPAVRYFSAALWCGRQICAMREEGAAELRERIEGDLSKLRGLRSSVSGSMRNGFVTNDLESFAEFGRMLSLHEIRSYNKMIALVSAHRPLCEDLCRSIAELDAAVAVLSFRKSLPYCSRPHYVGQMTINVQELYHPLLRDAVPNSAVLTKAAIITGSNASGKSTFIKAVAVNGILAMALDTCTARVYQAPRALVISSMAVRDNLTGGESYYVSEVRSLKRVLDHVDRMPCLCFVDEILKGTNTAERIAASAAILRHLFRENCFCLVATHDIELTELLAGEFENYHFSEQVTDEEITFDYLIKPGASKTTNAIRLLACMKFDREIVECAEKTVKSLQ